MKKILVVAAHPDDEVLGCGATLAKEIENGAEVKVVIIATGITSRYSSPENLKSEINKLYEEGKAANNILGIKEENLVFAEFPDQRLDTIPKLEIIHYLKKLIQDFKPEVIYTHHSGDYNLDHRIVFDIVNFVSRAYLGEHYPKKLYSFEVLSSTEWLGKEKDVFKPNRYEKLTQLQIDKKKQAMQAYKSELKEWPHPRSLKGVEVKAEQRGMEISSNYAEAFKLIRSVGD